MPKTKLGISVALMGAGLYFLGVFSFIPAFLLAAYVLLCEENAWLKRNAVRMVIIVVGFYLLHIGVDMLQEIWGCRQRYPGLDSISALTFQLPAWTGQHRGLYHFIGSKPCTAHERIQGAFQRHDQGRLCG